MRKARVLASLVFLVLLVVLFAAPAARAQEPQYFEEPPAKPRVEFLWDFLARYDHIDHWRYWETISRGRFELRPELDLTYSNFRLGVRAVFDYGTEENYENAIYGDNYVSRGAIVNAYYLLWTPGAWTIRAGAFDQPILSSEMLWDHRDVTTPGAAVTWTRSLGETQTLSVTGAGFYSPQRYSDESILGVGQVVWTSGDENRFSTQAAAAFWNLDMRDMDAQYYRENRVDLVDGKLQYRSKFQLLDLLFRFRFPVAGLPVLVSLDFVHNFGTVGTGPNAWEAAVTVGSVGTPRDFRAFFAYQYIGRDALVGAYNTDDWWWHTWAEGYRFGVSYTILPQVYIQPAVVFQRRLDYDYWLNRVTVDLVKMF